jgi:peptide/nickel transport system substrate-binding protein
MTAIGRRGALALATAAAFAPTARAEAGKRFITANNSGYDTLDPHTVFDIGRIGSRLNLYDCLVRWVGNPPELKLWLADRIDIAPDGVTYTVTMKQGAKFHDGSPIGADDVVFSMERILAMKQGAYGLYKGIVDPGRTKALDAHTLQFTLNQPYAVFSSTLSELWVVNSRLLRQNDRSGDMGAGWLARNEAGSGGFRLRRYDPARPPAGRSGCRRASSTPPTVICRRIRSSVCAQWTACRSWRRTRCARCISSSTTRGHR